ncbi:transient receptor potential cation channel subfamily V member 4-like [Gigaspora margarita]|uniref:Transient receptor potential cation channel subfamily V member 4-like n=1 Tax=Gigaspora margarita TaxID=4874 RepID=A0A8H4ADY6_GIGMA|nr:transient receptor potential cation channel subfamily V member 4-like [Gigaspora margarita]
MISNEELKISIPSESNNYNRIKKHKESIDHIFVSQYMKDIGNIYVVTYSKEHNSILGWSIDNIENDGHGQQQPDEFYELDKQYKIKSFALYYDLYKKFLSLCLKDRSKNDCYKQCLIDLNGKAQFFELVHSDSNDKYGRYTIGFLRNDDLILVSSYDLKIYKYLTKDMSKNIETLKYSEIYDIEIPKSLYNKFICSSIYLEKLFLFIQNRKTLILQFDLLKMNLDRQYDSYISWNSQYSSCSHYEFATKMEG